METCGQGGSASAAQSCDFDSACCYCLQGWKTKGSIVANTDSCHANATHTGRSPLFLQRAFKMANIISFPLGRDRRAPATSTVTPEAKSNTRAAPRSRGDGVGRELTCLPWAASAGLVSVWRGDAPPIPLGLRSPIRPAGSPRGGI